MTAKAVIKQWLTESDGATFCPVRALSLGSAALYHVGAVVGIVQGVMHLDIATLGQYLHDISILAGTTGFSVGVKSALNGDTKNEPPSVSHPV